MSPLYGTSETSVVRGTGPSRVNVSRPDAHLGANRMISITLDGSNDCQIQLHSFANPDRVDPGVAPLEVSRMERLINATGDAFQQ